MNFAGWQAAEKPAAVDALAESAADAQARYAEIVQLLLAAGYFRARIATLSAFDKVVGGMAWCMTASSVDVDVAFQENATIGQKIKIGEGIERSLRKMKCRIPLQAHQIQGLDYAAIFPVVQWLVKQVYAFRQEIGDAMRRLSVSRFDRSFTLPSDAELAERRAKAVPAARELAASYAPARRLRPKAGLERPSAMHASYVLIEYGTRMGALQPGADAFSAPAGGAAGGGGSGGAAEEGGGGGGGAAGGGGGRRASDAGGGAAGEGGADGAGEAAQQQQLASAMSEMAETGELSLSQSRISKLVGMGATDIAQAASEFAQKSQALLADGELANVHRMRAERDAVERQLQQARRLAEAEAERAAAAAAERGAAAEGTGALEAQLAAQAARRQRAADEAAELRRQAEEADPTQMAELQSLVALNTKLKQQQGDFKKQCKTQLQQMQQERAKQEAHEQQDADATADEHLARVQEIERVYAAETAKADKMRRLLGQKGRSIASLQRQIDDIPTRAELMQYERRFRELYQQVASKSEETKKYYDSYNMLDEKKGYLVKEASLINSIHENFAKSAAGGGGRDKLVESVEGVVKSVQQSLDKVKARLADEVAQKEAAQLQYDKLVDKERKYFKLVKEFQLECERNEQVG